MTPAKDNPLLLLLTTGVLLGLYFPLGKLAHAAGFDPMLWALVISLVPGVLIAIASVAMGTFRLQGAHLVFALVSGLLAYVVPNALGFSALPHVGSGFMSLMYAFSPLVTAGISMAAGVRPPNGRLLAGVAFGFAGAFLIALSRKRIAA